MHTKIFVYDDKSFRVHHNGGYDGNVTIQDNITREKIELPAQLLYDFTAEMLRSRLISNLEDADTQDILSWAGSLRRSNV